VHGRGGDALFPNHFEEDLFKYIVEVREPLLAYSSIRDKVHNDAFLQLKTGKVRGTSIGY